MFYVFISILNFTIHIVNSFTRNNVVKFFIYACCMDNPYNKQLENALFSIRGLFIKSCMIKNLLIEYD